MNTTEKKLVLGFAIVSIAGWIFLHQKNAANKPVKILGLDAKNSLMFAGSVALLAAAISAHNYGLTKKLIA